MDTPITLRQVLIGMLCLFLHSIPPTTASLLEVWNEPAINFTELSIEEPSIESSNVPFRLQTRQSGSNWWLANINRRNTIPYGNYNSSYKIFRNVRDYGAKGDGTTDDTEAINNAISDGNRCGLGCDSSTTTPAIVYFPPGNYCVSTPIIMYYYTQVIGDALNLPTLKALPNFQGIGVLNSDVYLPYGVSWYTNQNNFYRQVRNFIIDLTAADKGAHGIHWQVAQATSLQNIVFNMRTDGQDDGSNQQQGIFMDNGSGGWMEDLIFNGGGICAFLGNQQFTTRNFTFNNCATAIFQNWDWLWAFKSFTFNRCQIGIDITQGGSVEAVGSILLQDSVFNKVEIGILTTFATNSTPVSGASAIIDNVDFRGAQVAIAYPNKTTILPGGSHVDSWVQGRVYSAFYAEEQVGNLTCWLPQANSARIQTNVTAPPKPAALLDSNGKIVERSKPQYEGYSLSSIVSVRDNGATGDGITDDTDAIQAIFNNYQDGQIIYFDHGAYVITHTVNVPKNIRIQGEIWPMIMAQGSAPAFSDPSNPQPVFRVGQPGDVGTVEIIELVFQTLGPAPGAIMMEWNVAGTTKGAAAMFDTHWRIGGTAGTELQSDICSKNQAVAHGSNSSCVGAFLLLHVTRTGSVLMNNIWGWVSDHELDRQDHNQIDIYNGRGVLIECEGGGVWMYGTSFEHSVLYNYQIANAKNVYMSVIQSETAYMQNNPNALTPFTPNTAYSDPDFGWCSPVLYTCPKTWGLRIYNSTYVLNYGAGMYSFFNNYDQGCLLTESCQQFMVSVEESEAVYLYGLSTKGTTTLVAVDQVALVPQSANANGFCQTVAIFEFP
ncbi:MAG: hypothetical protein M1820_007287 [Bogoriella megaspora]|nr:MAG: hypothetical protein M1820_007287 [Bogoriella megaspora]